MKFKILSLFSGAGGLDLGFEKAGFEIIAANESDKICYETFEYNFPKTKLYKKSIKKLDAKEINFKVDGIVGGPPCQSWSEAGKQLGIKDHRGKLFYEYIRLLKSLKPKFFLAENVSGMLHKKHEQSVKRIISKFRSIGYDVKMQMLDANDFDVPQNRKRVFIVGFRSDLKVNFHFPQPQIFLQKKVLKDAIKDLNNALPGLKFNKTNGISAKKNNIQNNEFMTGNFSSIYMSRNRVRSWNEPSFTIQAGGRHAPLHPDAPIMIKVGKDKMKFNQKFLSKYRRLSIRECARIQTFPDDFIFFYNNLSDGYKMIGNAVPVNLSKALAREILKGLIIKKSKAA